MQLHVDFSVFYIIPDVPQRFVLFLGILSFIKVGKVVSYGIDMDDGNGRVGIFEGFL